MSDSPRPINPAERCRTLCTKWYLAAGDDLRGNDCPGPTVEGCHMTTARVNWAEARPLIEKHTGPVLRAEQVEGGVNAQIAVALSTESGDFFVKGMRTDQPRVRSQQRQRKVNPGFGICRRIWSGRYKTTSGTCSDSSTSPAGTPPIPRALRTC